MGLVKLAFALVGALLDRTAAALALQSPQPAGGAGRLGARQEELRRRWALLRKQGSGRGHFEWVDGLLVRAVERGGWVVLDNVNLCSPSVLDRLNSLLEPGGELLREHGADEAVKWMGLTADEVRGSMDRLSISRLDETVPLGYHEASQRYLNRSMLSDWSDDSSFASESHNFQPSLFFGESTSTGLGAAASTTPYREVSN